MFSISVAFFSVILAGRVICGMKLFDSIFFKKLIYSCVWYILKMTFRLKLPLIIECELFDKSVHEIIVKFVVLHKEIFINNTN